MKKLLFLMLAFILLSCEDVVDVALEESDPRLVVEASLVWNETQPVAPQIIKLTTTAPYFSNEIPLVKSAIVSVSSENGEEYFFSEVSDGIYRNDNMTPQLDTEYTLMVETDSEIYTATAQYAPTPKLEFVEQELGGFSGEDYEFKVFYTDPPGVKNYYLFKYANEKISLQIYDDEFTDGNQTFAFFNDEDAKPGDDLYFEIQGISADFYEYMYILRSQSGSSNGGPFQTQPSVVRGNIINTTNRENYAFGYFRLSGAHSIMYEVK